MIDRAVELRCVGGMYGEPNKPTEFMCLILKMLQIQPDFDIVVELIRNEDYKYVRLLGERGGGERWFGGAAQGQSALAHEEYAGLLHVQAHAGWHVLVWWLCACVGEGGDSRVR